MKESKSNNKGFTLVELVIVLAIMAVLSSAVFYSYMLVSGQYARECANDLSTALDKEKNYALARSASVDCYMELVKTGNGYSVKFYIPKDAIATGHDPASGAFKSDDWRLAEELKIARQQVGITCEFMKKTTKLGEVEIDDDSSVKFVYNRTSGALKGVAESDGASDGLNTINTDCSDIIINITGGRKYQIHIYTATGKHELERIG